ncbi:MAG: hypothetical protein ACRCVX_07785 [Shewanella sp.]
MANERIKLASFQRVSGPRFTPSKDGKSIDDGDFIFDAIIGISGDFGSDEARFQFAQWIADVLNKSDLDLPKREYVEFGGDED